MEPLYTRRYCSTMPYVKIDGETGFSIENNSSACIAENVMRALNSPDLVQIIEDGRRFVEAAFYV